MGKLQDFVASVNSMAEAIGQDIYELRQGVLGVINDDVTTTDSTWSSNKINNLIGGIELTLTQIQQDYATKQFVLDAIDGLQSIRIEKVDVLPPTGETNVIYLVPSTSSTQENIFDEYIWVDNQWELIGTTEVDLSNYATLTDLDTKVDKVAGKGLSDQNFTIEEKNKLAGVAPNANNYVHPTTAGNKHIPAGGTVGQTLRNTASGTAEWHSLSPSDVGLGGVQNYGIATQPEAEAGTVNNKYSTPLRVANYVDAQVGTVDPLTTYNTNAGN